MNKNAASKTLIFIFLFFTFIKIDTIYSTQVCSVQ